MFNTWKIMLNQINGPISAQSNSNDTSSPSNFGFTYKAFVHGRINDRWGITAAVTASFVIYVGLAVLGNIASVYPFPLTSLIPPY